MNFSSISFAKALARERERKYRMTILTMVAEGMRKKGASERSIHTALEGFHEYLKPSRNTGKLEHPDPAATPELSDEEPGILLSEVETQHDDKCPNCPKLSNT